MMSLPAEPPTPPTRTSETLRAELKEVNAHLDSMRRAWEDERRKLLTQNIVCTPGCGHYIECFGVLTPVHSKTSFASMLLLSMHSGKRMLML